MGSKSRIDRRNLADEIIFDSVKPFDTQGYSSDLFLGTHCTAGCVALKRFRHRARAGDLETLARVRVSKFVCLNAQGSLKKKTLSHS